MATQYDLLEAFTEHLYDALANGGYKVTNEDGSTGRIPIDSTFLNVIRQFLKDYPVDRHVSTEDFMKSYKDLPFFQAAEKATKKRDKRDAPTPTPFS